MAEAGAPSYLADDDYGISMDLESTFPIGNNEFGNTFDDFMAWY